MSITYIPKYTNSYVAVLDILGFKNLLNSQEDKACQNLYNLFTAIDFDSNSAAQMKSANSFDDETMNIPLDDVQQYIMSDTIIFSIDATKINARAALIVQVAYFAGKLLVNNPDPILVRGAVSKGDYYLNKKKRFMYGPAMADAYLLEENSAIYPRIIVHQGIFDNVEKEFEMIGFPQPDVWLYDDFDGFKCIDYFRTVSLEKVIPKIEQIIDTTTDLKIRAKNYYIKNFFDTRINKHDFRW